MFIDFGIKRSASSVGATCAGNQASMPLLRSFGRFADGFYKQVAPTALRLGSRTRQVIQQAVRRRVAHPIVLRFRIAIDLKAVTPYSPRNRILLNSNPKPNPKHNPEAISPTTSDPWSVLTRVLVMAFKSGKSPNMHMNRPTMILARRLVVCALIRDWSKLSSAAERPQAQKPRRLAQPMRGRSPCAGEGGL